jgi:hypothetical protein
MGEGLGGADAAKLIGDCSMDAVERRQHLAVPESQNALMRAPTCQAHRSATFMF